MTRTLYNKIRMYKYSKPKKPVLVDLEDDSSSVTNDMDKLFPDLFHKETNTKIYRNSNHIYFRDDVTMDNITKLEKLINEVNQEFKELKHKLSGVELSPKPIYLHISSYGGDLYAGFIGVNAIRNSVIPVYTVIEGYAMSCGSLMFVSGVKRYMTKNSYQLIHQLSSFRGWGTFSNIEDDYVNTKQLMRDLTKIYEDNTHGKLPKSVLKDILKKDLELDYETCLKYGLVDGLYTYPN